MEPKNDSGEEITTPAVDEKKGAEELMNSLEDMVSAFLSHNEDESNIHQSKPTERNVTIEEEVKKTEHLFIQSRDLLLKYHRARYWYVVGRLYNITPRYRIKALEALARAVKLDPEMIDAWNELGECYWKFSDVRMAKNCFEGALKQKPNKISYRNLSMIARKEGQTNEEKVKQVQLGLSLAKLALQLDLKDAVSWTVLGNSHLACYFIKQEHKSISNAIAAYKQAEKFIQGKGHSELYYNKGVALKFDEKYEEALSALLVAHTLNPEWTQAKLMYDSLLNYCLDLYSLITTKGKIKAKIIGKYQKDLIANKDPYSVNYKEVLISELEIGSNKKKAVVGKVLWSKQIDESFPFTFGLMDKNGSIAAVTVYNLMMGKGVIIGDTVFISQPIFDHFQLDHNDKVVAFDKIRVDCPLTLLVNGKKLPMDYKGVTVMVSSDL